MQLVILRDNTTAISSLSLDEIRTNNNPRNFQIVTVTQEYIARTTHSCFSCAQLPHFAHRLWGWCTSSLKFPYAELQETMVAVTPAAGIAPQVHPAAP